MLMITEYRSLTTVFCFMPLAPCFILHDFLIYHSALFKGYFGLIIKKLILERF